MITTYLYFTYDNYQKVYIINIVPEELIVVLIVYIYYNIIVLLHLKTYIFKVIFGVNTSGG